MKMWVFIREILAGASIIFLSASMAAPSSAQPQRQVVREALPQTSAPLTLKFDGIDLASFKTAEARSVQRDIYSRVRSSAKRAGVEATPAEMERATKKIIKLLNSDYVTQELSKNNKARVTINVDLTFQPLTTEAKFQF